ncbi:hypothetical protein B0H12DRAFT_1169493 [Mycena haematopus]|nr:hypothetical protein B0H12DRAFT_1169493 [Mycena haematopus]
MHRRTAHCDGTHTPRSRSRYPHIIARPRTRGPRRRSVPLSLLPALLASSPPHPHQMKEEETKKEKKAHIASVIPIARTRAPAMVRC